MGEPALFDAYPWLRGVIPWLELGVFPTRVHRVEGLLPRAVELWVKREDESGVEYGGNKIRKLEFILAEARAMGATRVATVGGIGSHHVLATAVYARRAALPVEAVLFPQPLSDHVRAQLRADLALGVQLSPTRGMAGVPLAAWRARRRPGTLWIPGGGSSATGTLGYVSCAAELLAQQAEGELPALDVVYAALGSCGTVAGLLVGLGGPHAPTVVGVRVVDRVVGNASATLRLARRTRALIHGDRPPPPLAPLRVDHRFFGGAYGRSTPAAEAAVAAAARVGLELEPTYTGKALAALLADADAGLLDGKRVLFLDTFSSVDLSSLLARPEADPARLPPLLRRHFAGG